MAVMTAFFLRAIELIAASVATIAFGGMAVELIRRRVLTR